MNESLRWKLTESLGSKNIFLSVVQLPDSGYLAGGSGADLHRLQYGRREASTLRKGHDGYVSGVQVVNEHVVSAGYDGQLRWRKIDSWEDVHTIPAHKGWIRQLTVSPDQSIVVTAGADMVCRLWNAFDATLLIELKGHPPKTPQHFPSMLYAVAISPQNELVASADKVGQIFIWNTRNGTIVKQLTASAMYTWDAKNRLHSIGGIRALAFSPDGSRLAVGGINPVGNVDHLRAPFRVEVFHIESGNCILEWNGDDSSHGLVEYLAFHPQKNWLLATGGGKAGFFQVLDYEANRTLSQEPTPMRIHDLAISHDWARFCAVGHERVAFWELERHTS